MIKKREKKKKKKVEGPYKIRNNICVPMYILLPDLYTGIHCMYLIYVPMICNKASVCDQIC